MIIVLLLFLCRLLINLRSNIAFDFNMELHGIWSLHRFSSPVLLLHHQLLTISVALLGKLLLLLLLLLLTIYQLLLGHLVLLRKVTCWTKLLAVVSIRKLGNLRLAIRLKRFLVVLFDRILIIDY